MTKSPRLTNWAGLWSDNGCSLPTTMNISESAIPELTHKFYEAHKIYLTSRPVILSGWSHLDYHHSGRNTENRILREKLNSHFFIFTQSSDWKCVCVCQKMSKNAHNKSEAKQTPSAARSVNIHVAVRKIFRKTDHFINTFTLDLRNTWCSIFRSSVFTQLFIPLTTLQPFELLPSYYTANDTHCWVTGSVLWSIKLGTALSRVGHYLWFFGCVPPLSIDA